MLRLEGWVEIIALRLEGLSIRAIARRLGCSRNTVRAALRRDGPPSYERKAMPSKLDPYKDHLLARLAEFPELSVEALFEEISAMGYAGGATILKDFTRPYRVRRREPVVRFETPPGRQAQCDFSELGIHEVRGRRLRLYLFHMVLGFSRMTYAEVTTAADSATFLAAHVRAFSYFGGMPREILYDNAKICAIKHTRTVLTFNATLFDFAGRFGFAPRLCRPYRARTKGKVERSFGYVKDRFLVGRVFLDIDDLNTQLSAWIENTANRRIHATTGERPCDRLPLEGLTPFSSAKPWRLPEPPARPSHSCSPSSRMMNCWAMACPPTGCRTCAKPTKTPCWS